METERSCATYLETIKPDRVRIDRKSALYGSRLVAVANYKPGEVILPLLGLPSKRSYRTIQTGIETHIENELLACLNHSCAPSAIVNTREMTVEALAAVNAGQELTFFYPSTEWELGQPFICLCGAPECIHVVAGAKYLSIDTLSRYFINAHIREIGFSALSKMAAAGRSDRCASASPDLPVPRRDDRELRQPRSKSLMRIPSFFFSASIATFVLMLRSSGRSVTGPAMVEADSEPGHPKGRSSPEPF
jgi:hypothetical protein